eukprot:CAMPEP_0115280850 /NCGR_PEP_ID=MMETSP0270-20121206/59009_1 /TAXON_ID=71861 /ORGANISM="Scrippsiella trochoidea, Strain CCMP3099" /LENGTH=338 /DNA_ID=CAMNT_0002697617 /DNA_START=584 /DNA_END=1601 /DNA_ORIENTATION=+
MTGQDCVHLQVATVGLVVLSSQDLHTEHPSQLVVSVQPYCQPLWPLQTMQMELLGIPARLWQQRVQPDLGFEEHVVAPAAQHQHFECAKIHGFHAHPWAHAKAAPGRNRGHTPAVAVTNYYVCPASCAANSSGHLWGALRMSFFTWPVQAARPSWQANNYSSFRWPDCANGCPRRSRDRVQSMTWRGGHRHRSAGRPWGFTNARPRCGAAMAVRAETAPRDVRPATRPAPVGTATAEFAPLTIDNASPLWRPREGLALTMRASERLLPKAGVADRCPTCISSRSRPFSLTRCRYWRCTSAMRADKSRSFASALSSAGGTAGLELLLGASWTFMDEELA